ncbi:ribonuclease H-like domain-containing protein [Halobacterium sp. NMX12-1]|uniref:Ribonuclease H-like domain-containing protein n=1 Tax=Halobacterium sp. NMX12-1 TaxID=3166650 RepID=A0AAU8CCU5_9EURY
MGRDRIAIDLETIPTVKDPDFNTPSHWTPFCVAVGYDSGDGDPEVEVLFRDGPSLDEEAQLLHSMIDWIADRIGDSPVLLTYNGESYDLPILKHQSYVINDEISGSNIIERMYLFTQTCDHVDLIQLIKDRKGYWVSLDDALDEYGIDSDDPEWLNKPVTGGDMPEMGLELLSDAPNDNLREAVRRYAASDVQPLFELDRKLRG